MEVKFPPAVILTSSNLNVLEGEDVKLTCSATANPSDVIYKWYKNDVIINGDLSTSYFIHKITREDHGAIIACEVKNSVGESRATHTLSVNFGPVFKSPLPAVFGAELGNEVKLKCEVEGNPQPEIIWLLEGNTRVLSTESELNLGEMAYDLVGKYLCRASVRGFAEISGSTTVFIKGAFYGVPCEGSFC